MEIPSVTNFNTGFKIGAQYIKPNIKVIATCIGSFEDAAKAKETADALIKHGVDVITHDADQAGLGVIEAAQEANILAIGSVGDQSDIAPDTVVSSVINDMSNSLLFIAQKVQDKTLKPQAYKLGAGDGVLYLAPYRNFDSKIPAALKAKIQKIIDDLKSGKINVGALKPQ
jgi:basic membrane protein A